MHIPKILTIITRFDIINNNYRGGIMRAEDRNQLITNAAAKVHEAWCEGELRAFYSRFTAEVKNGADNATALRNACYKNGKQRNVLEFDIVWLGFHEITTAKALQTFEGFMDLFNKGVIKVKRFTERTLTEEEQKKAGAGNYNAETKTENILRPFDKLSADSQKENLEAAKGAVYVYEAYAKRGATIDQFSSPEAKRAIGTLIHADWMRRNERTEANKHLFVPYEELDEWAKQQDLDVFEALIGEVKKDEARYAVAQEEGLMKLYPDAQEESALDFKIPERARARWEDETALRF